MKVSFHPSPATVRCSSLCKIKTPLSSFHLSWSDSQINSPLLLPVRPSLHVRDEKQKKTSFKGHVALEEVRRVCVCKSEEKTNQTKIAAGRGPAAEIIGLEVSAAAEGWAEMFLICSSGAARDRYADLSQTDCMMLGLAPGAHQRSINHQACLFSVSAGKSRGSSVHKPLYFIYIYIYLLYSLYFIDINTFFCRSLSSHTHT